MREENFEKDLKLIETDSIKCEGCGGTMTFDPDTQTLKCAHCGNEIDFKKNLEVKEYDILEGFEKAEKWNPDEQASYKCQNCGAVIVVSRDEEATVCPFCGTSHVIKEGSFDGIKPQAVIPFKFGSDKASEYCKKWVKSRIFAPSKFKKNLTRDNIRGVYEPCFTFDSRTRSIYDGRVGYRRTRTVGSGKNRRVETYIQYKHISGVYDWFFDDVLVATNKNFDQTKLEKLAPYDTKSACVYESKYLSGFFADGYEKDLKTSWDDAKSIIDARIRTAIKQKYNADVVDYIHVTTNHSDVTYKYLLLPVYLTSYKYGKKRYGVIVNASTGKVRGKTPVSPLRVLLAILLGLGVAGCCYFSYMRLSEPEYYSMQKVEVLSENFVFDSQNTFNQFDLIRL